MREELIEEVDKLLLECRKNGFIGQTNKDTSDLRKESINYLQAVGLITPRINKSHKLTQIGYEVIEKGGFKNYQKEKNKKEEKEEQIKELTIKQLKGTIFQVKYWWLIIIISAVISFITGNFSLILEWFK